MTPTTQTNPLAALEQNRRILVVDDNESIHADFKKILGGDPEDAEFDADESEMFGSSARASRREQFELDSAFQGQEALQLVQAAVKAGRRYAMAFMDVRMPPGWDGVETALKLWEADPDIQIVICTAYSDYSWEEMMEKIGSPERLLILKKPFDGIEVMQFAHALTEKWSLLQAANRNTAELQRIVGERTAELKSTIGLLESEIAEHQKADGRVREQAMLLEKARDAIVVRDMDGTILFWNHGAERLYGWTAAEAVGQTLFDLLKLDGADETVCAARKSFFEKGEWTGLLAPKTKQGRAISVEAHCTLVCDEAGSPKSALCIYTDVTEKRLLEAQFLHAQRMESIGLMASGIAHDLNNVLSPIVLSLDMLKASVGPREAPLVDAMECSARRATDVVRQLLLFARGVAPRQGAVQPLRLIQDIEKITAEAFRKSIQFHSSAPDDAWMVKADPTQIHQVLLNLCINARDAMPDGGRIDLRASNVDVDAARAASIGGLEPGPHVLIEVADTGTGIPPEVLEKIFEPFFTTKALGKGTGLGLSTVFGIVKKHGGAVTVRSKVGTGTTFGIYLPALMDANAGAPMETTGDALRAPAAQAA